MSRMSNCSVVLVVLAAVLAATGSASASDGEALGWLTGCWSGDEDGAHFEECWLHPAGGNMLGVNRTHTPDGEVAFEFLRIGRHGDGVAYFASPGGRPAVAFSLVESADGLAVFYNPGHDFPQRITYRLEGDTLRAEVEALQEGEWVGFEIVWQRSSLAR